MNDVTLANVVEYASRLTVISLLVFIIIGGYRKWWVWGYQFRDMKAERDEYKTLFHRSIGVFSKVVSGEAITLANREEDS